MLWRQELLVPGRQKQRHGLCAALNAGVFLGEAGQALMANIDYEIPYLRKQAAKYSQQITDGEKKHAEYLKSAATCAQSFKQVGIRAKAGRARSLTSECLVAR